ncbi:nucleotidyltransferase [Alteribacter aurantiacus]|uniref:nucleotidyltransferase n=1 Tax=Alteribacter aurantiacus TaxID=254410 RepID=UPI00042653B3|nr:nucleotidyltransferase [Alteribacter aurantiacus]
MRSVGLIVEYNPFHNGHLYHLTESKKVTKADVVVAVMSGSFLQRGEPALVDKWARTKMALLGGCDLVVELPYLYAVQHATLFARGAVGILDKLGVDTIAFGSENGNIDAFQETIAFMKEYKASHDKAIKPFLEKGFSYPRASSAAYEKLKPASFTGVDLTAPNNILGIQYCEALDELDSQIIPYTITREKAGYHDPVPTDQAIASATSIRNILSSPNGTLEDVRPFVPDTTYDVLQSYLKTYGMIHQWSNYFPNLQHQIITQSTNELKEKYEVSEGLEHRFKKAVMKETDFETFLSFMKTKRYTRTRLQRAMVHMLLNTTKDEANEWVHPLSPDYIRILGMSSLGQTYLSRIKKKLDIPLISNASKGTKIPSLQKDILAATIHHMPLVQRGTGSVTKEYKEKPVILKKHNEGASV